jgi:hypothetical protein
MQLAVLNPGSRDSKQSFPNHAGTPDDRVHAPVNYHAYAACTQGSFHPDVKSIPENTRAVLILLGNSTRPALRALEALRAQGRTVAVSWKESGAGQVARRLDDPANLEGFRRVCSMAGAAISSTPELVPLYRAAGCARVEYIPTPYPVDDARWDFSRPLRDRSGIFIGTREWGVPSRAHASALLQACATGAPVTVCNPEGRRGRKRLAALECPNLRVIEGRLPYTEYLRAMASCRVVFQQDTSQVPGQVAGDALLCRMPCLGGNGAVDRDAFEPDDLALLLRDDAAWQRAVDRSQERARNYLAFAPVAARLRAFYQSLENRLAASSRRDC